MNELDIKREFLDEAAELIDDCEEALALLKDSPYNPELIDRMFRDLHTVKGSAGVVGLTALSKFVHKFEDLVNQYREQGVIPEQSICIFVEANDWIASWLDELKKDIDYEVDSTDIEDSLKLLLTKEKIEINQIDPNEKINGFEIFDDDSLSGEQDNRTLPKVLLVDDEEAMLKVIEGYLLDVPIEIFKANSALEGFTIFKRENIDLIVSDLKMPDMNGLEFIRKVRESDQNVEVIFLSAHANRSSLEQFMKLRTFAFVDKSDSHIEIVNTVLNGLKAKKVTDAVSLITKLNFEIYLDFNLLSNGKDVSNRIREKLEKVARLSNIIGDTDLVLNSDIKKIAS